MIRKLIKIKEVNNFLRQCTSFQYGFMQTQQKRFLTDESNVDKARHIESNPFADKSSPLEGGLPPVRPLDERDKKLKVLQLEADIARQEGRRVPELSFFKETHWDHILTLNSRTARLKHYAYLWQIAVKKLSKEKKKVERQQALIIRRELEKKDSESNQHILYALTHTSYFLRIYDSTVNFWQNNKLTRAMQFGEKLVLDCSYDDHMHTREALNTAKQLQLCFAQNRMHDDPFDIHFCNVNYDSVCMRSLQRHIPTMGEPWFPLNTHEKCFMDLFPKERLVYLTPHCRNNLREYNPDDIYIIGAIVDTINNEPVSLAKAKRLGIRMARLPLDQYLQWGSGSGKSLTLNQMISIMLDQKSTGDWYQSLKHVPRRKIVDEEYGEKRRFNHRVRVDKLFEYEKDIQKSVRNRTEGLKFNLETWASKKN